jgi:hypothetical protein
MTSTATLNPFSPSNVDPSEFVLLGYTYSGENYGYMKAYSGERDRLAHLFEVEGITWADVRRHENHGCASCGARYAHGAVLLRRSDKVAIAIGQDCAGNLFQCESKADALRLVAERANKAEATRKAKAAFIAAHPEIDDLLALDHYIATDMRCYFNRKGILSEKQVALLRKLHADVAEKAAKLAEKLASGIVAPTGRVVISGEVLSTKWVESNYGSALKMRVRDDRGFTCWGSVPKLDDGQYSDLVGKKITFKATMEHDNTDPTHGWFRRPTNGKLVAA